MIHDDRLRAYYDRELPTRSGLSEGSPRRLRLEQFVDACITRGSRAVIEVGSGAGHDGTFIHAAGLDYTAVDLSGVGAGLCRARGLAVVQATATALPFADGAFDAGWTMSTLMHLPGEDLVLALDELKRVIRRGGLLEVGVWGADADGVRVDAEGRYFRQRSDARLEDLLSRVGDLVAFETWDHLSGGGHYQWGRLVVAGP